MQLVHVTVDFGGIVIFEPRGLEQFLDTPKISDGENLYRRFTTTEDGDEICRLGAVIPIVGVNDASYKVWLRNEGEFSPVDESLIIFQNQAFPLKIEQRLKIADLIVFWEWEYDAGWQEIDFPPGFYSVCVRGYRRISNGQVNDCGFDIVFSENPALPSFTADLAMNMQVLELP